MNMSFWWRISSLFLLWATVSYDLSQQNTPIAEKIKKNIYVDNVITGTDKNYDLKPFYCPAKEISSKASMNLREWNSNSVEFLSIIPDSDRSSNLDQNVLGLNWNLTRQLLLIMIPKLESNNPLTKRYLLKMIATIFDQLCFIQILLVIKPL